MVGMKIAEGKIGLMMGEEKMKEFVFENIITPDVTQDKFFHAVGETAVVNAIGAFNSSIIAYGQVYCNIRLAQVKPIPFLEKGIFHNQLIKTSISQKKRA
jgi:hypothetical protein